MFSKKDLEQIATKGITPNQVVGQLDRFKKGFPHINIMSSATIGNGIKKLPPEEVKRYADIYDHREVDVIKFVPASGAATRMFKSLFLFLERFDGTKEQYDRIAREEKKIGKLFTELDEFAFYDELSNLILDQTGQTIEQAQEDGRYDLIAELILTRKGLNYGQLPKGLLKFHQYEDETRTPVQEHLVEALAYANKGGKARIHFTVSPEHQNLFQAHVDKTLESHTVTRIAVSFSTQLSKTDTIASTTDCAPFRDENGKLLFRPAGHGALLENLNGLNSEIIFIKNIDNVVPDRVKEETIQYKKALAGVLLTWQDKIFSLLREMDSGKDVFDEARKVLAEMGCKGTFTSQEVFELLNRPIRVCGMVKNEGEPGGGPFWVESGRTESLQIVEAAQVDSEDKSQRATFKSGTHFNPVDLVCGVKNYKGVKFDLLRYRDEEAGFISEKSYNGEKLLAMELPGLWNGSMAHWNTILVEVPLITFNPVKTVTDLLKSIHR